MTMIDVGIYGAKVQSWKKSNPRDMLKVLLDEMPGATEESLLAEMRSRLKADSAEAYLDSVIEYWFVNNYRSIVHPVRPADRTKSKAAQNVKVGQIKEKIKTRIQHEAKLILLDMVMPNGKALRDCTGKDCANAGGWLTKIAEKIKPNDKVGNVLSENQVRKLFSGN